MLFSDPPINIKGDYTEERGALREQVTLQCDVCADPEPTKYTWAKDGVTILEASGSSFVIANVTEEDFGNYTCAVQNDIDTSVFVISLEASSE